VRPCVYSSRRLLAGVSIINTGSKEGLAMCMIDGSDDERVLVLSEKYRKARKMHKCDECGRTIERKESYHYETFIHEGVISTHKTCAHCMVVRNWLNAECSGFIYAFVQDDFGEHAQDSYYGYDIKRAYIAMRKDWRLKDGTLRPLPVLKDYPTEKHLWGIYGK